MTDAVNFYPYGELSCSECGLSLREHPRDGDHWLRLSMDDMSTLSRREWDIVIRLRTRINEGLLDPPLPPPAERRRIREAAGLSQADVAELLHVSRHTVSRYEKMAGYRDGRRLPGREPVWEPGRATRGF